MMQSQQMYAGNQMGINRSPVPNQNYNSPYPPNNNTMNSVNTQYNNYNSTGSCMPPTQTVPTSTHMPQMPVQAHSPKGAQAAAHAAMIAAASSASRPPIMKPPGGPNSQPAAPSTTSQQVPQHGFPPNSQAPVSSSTSHYSHSSDGPINSGFSTPSPAPPGTPHSDTGSTGGPPSNKQPSTPGGQNTVPGSPAPSPSKMDELDQSSKSENLNDSLTGVSCDTDIKPVISMVTSDPGELFYSK